MRLISSVRADGTIRPVAALRRSSRGGFIRPHSSVLKGYHWDHLLGFWIDKRGIWDPILEKTVYDDKEKVVAKARLERHHRVLREIAAQEVIKTTREQVQVKGTKKRVRYQKENDVDTLAGIRKRVKVVKSGRKPGRPKKDRESNSLVDEEMFSSATDARNTHARETQHTQSNRDLLDGIDVNMIDGQEEMDLSEIPTVAI